MEIGSLGKSPLRPPYAKSYDAMGDSQFSDDAIKKPVQRIWERFCEE